MLMMTELPPFHRTALLLDMDGTLLDLAVTPDSVEVPQGLPDALTTIKGLLSGALAVVTGRAILTVDELFGAVPYAVAGEHGGAIRPAPGADIERAELKAPPESWLQYGAAMETAFPGAIFEQKPRGFGLHFRLVPEAGPAIHDALTSLIGDSHDFFLMHGHMMWEVRPRGVDKGDAVARLMTSPPFLGRLPVFIGDDITDEDGMRVARSMGGAGLRVPDVFVDAAGVRAWLYDTAARGDWGALA
jgi:trehalose 6-phosphate phosphatase